MNAELSEKQLKVLRQELRGRQQVLQEQIRAELVRSDEEQFGDVAGPVHDTGDESFADMQVDLNNKRISVLIGQLREVETAIERIAEGSYGLCEDCEEPIPFERLKAYPTARRCVQHQARFEQSYSAEAVGQPKL